jgi:hypothetical protein
MSYLIPLTSEFASISIVEVIHEQRKLEFIEEINFLLIARDLKTYHFANSNLIQ